MTDPTAGDLYYAGKLAILLPWGQALLARLNDLVAAPSAQPGEFFGLVSEVQRLQMLLAQTIPPGPVLTTHRRLVALADQILKVVIDLRKDDRETASAGLQSVTAALAKLERELQLLGLLRANGMS